jgi:hypothetical protein
MNYSFFAYATQFAKFSPPISALAVAAPLAPPISLRKVMSQGAPYQPDLTLFGQVDNSKNPGEVAFFWADDANLPPWNTNIPTPSPNPARMATSWIFRLWEVPSEHVLVNNATVGYGARDPQGSIQYDYQGGLIGKFGFEITAYNAYGASPPAGVNSIDITLPFNPVLTATRTTGNNFVLTGSGFQAGTPVAFEVDGIISGAQKPLTPPPGSVTVASDGTFSKPVPCQSYCTQISGGELLFWALVNGTQVAGAKGSCV